MSYGKSFDNDSKNSLLVECQNHARHLVYIVENYKDIINAQVSNFFVQDEWKLIKSKWWYILCQLSPKELASFLDLQWWETHVVWPLSLLAFRHVVHYFSLRRQQFCLNELPKLLKTKTKGSELENSIESFNDMKLDNSCCHHSYNNENDSLIDPDKNYSCCCLHRSSCKLSNEQFSQKSEAIQHLDLQHCFRRHVKPKKQHEIVCLGKSISMLCAKLSTKNVVDIGAGYGHLSRLLSYGFLLNATTIEAVDGHAPTAKKFDNEVERDIMIGKTISKKLRKNLVETNGLPETTGNFSPCTSDVSGDSDILQKKKIDKSMRLQSVKPKHITGIVNPSMTVNDFRSLIENTLYENQDNCNAVNEKYKLDENEKFIMTGLHACGDLTPTMLRVFARTSNCVGIASVGCCYMRGYTKKNTDAQISHNGYPMSEFLRKLHPDGLSYEACEMACHTVDSYFNRLCEENEALQSHVYRAALQEIIIKCPEFTVGSIKLTLKNVHKMSFKEYATKAIKKLNLDHIVSDDEIIKGNDQLKMWREVVAFYVIRLSLAPVIESLILLDRMLFLLENDINAHLIPIFDPVTSPRNFALLAWKK